MRKFKFAGVSKVGGHFTLRATNRELPVYPQLLAREKNTEINIVKLSKPMTKEQIREHLARRREFRKPQILAVLKRGEKPAPKRAVKAKTTKAKATRKRAASKPEATSAAAA